MGDIADPFDIYTAYNAPSRKEVLHARAKPHVIPDGHYEGKPVPPVEPKPVPPCVGNADLFQEWDDQTPDERRARVKLAIEICKSCFRLQECRVESITYMSGVWGGIDCSARALTCSKGHLYTEETSKVRMVSPGKANRYCGTCRHERDVKRKYPKKSDVQQQSPGQP